jgi:DNA-binding transcriptional ArsR family regulator
MPETPALTIVPPLEPLLAALGAPVRWKILRELAAGEPLMVIEIAERIRESASLTSKHLAVLRKARAVETGRAGLYKIPTPYLKDPAQRLVDYGHCVLRLAEPAVS